MGDDGDPPDGFEEENAAFDRFAAIKMMDDVTLLREFRKLSNQHMGHAEALKLMEAEIKARSLLSEH